MSEGGSAELPGSWQPSRGRGEGGPTPGGGPCLSHPTVLRRTQAPCFPNAAFALSRRWTLRKVTRNDLNASFPWCEGCSREHSNEGGAFSFFLSCECPLCCCGSCRLVLSPGLKSTPDCSLCMQQPPARPGPSSQPWRDCLGCELSVFRVADPGTLVSLALHIPGASQKPQPTVRRGRGFTLVLAAFV